jgi:hypothetical protein
MMLATFTIDAPGAIAAAAAWAIRSPPVRLTSRTRWNSALGQPRRGHALVGDAGVVDQHVDASEALDGRLHDPLGVLLARHVGRDGQAAAAGVLDQRDRVDEPLGPAAGHHDVGARLRASLREADAEPRGRAGDDHDLVVQAEALEH